MKIVCNCGKFPVEVEKLAKTTGYQYTESVVGYYRLYKCECGETGWTYENSSR